MKSVINRMVDELRVLGPLALPAKFAAWDHEIEHPVPGHEESLAGDGSIAVRRDVKARPLDVPTESPSVAHSP